MLSLLAAAAVASSQCGTVPADTSTDIVALQKDADCYGTLAANGTAQIEALNEQVSFNTAQQQARLARIVWVKEHPAPRDILAPTPGSGAKPIASEFDPKSVLIPAWGKGTIPPSMGGDPLGAFRFTCGAGPLGYDDPILYPKQRGRSHLHQFFGNTRGNGDSTYESLRASGDSTCGGDGKGHALNRSLYWIPAMLDGFGNVVQPDGEAVYYKRIPLNDPHCGDPNIPGHYGFCIPIPHGIGFIVGSDLKGGYRQAHAPKQIPYVGAYRYNCITAQGLSIAGVSGQYFNLESLPKCAAGNQVDVVLQFPNCWNGKVLIAADGGSNVDYMYQGRCPPGYPYMMPAFLLSVGYIVKPGDDTTKWSLASDAMDPTKPRGWSLHGDYFGAWDPEALTTWDKFCIDGHLSGTGGDFCDGTMMNASVPLHLQPDGSLVRSFTNPRHLVPVPPMPEMK